MDPVRGHWGLKRSVEAVAVGVVIVGVVSVFLGLRPQKIQSSGCHFPAIYNFGDSNSDTGALSAVFYRLPSPYGNTFFGKPSGRFSDGRLMIDFIAQKLGLPFLSAYLDSVGANFRHGANFATGGSTILPIDGKLFEGRFSPISLGIQFSQFAQLKARVNEVLSQDKSSYVSSSIPRPEDFSKALYTFDMGQNDIHAGLRFKTVDQVLESISDMTAQLALTIEVQGGNCCTGVGLTVANGGAGGVVKAADLWRRVFSRFMGWGPTSLGLGLGLLAWAWVWALGFLSLVYSLGIPPVLWVEFVGSL